jgi:hypothetical protein
MQKVGHFTLDNAANNKTMMKELQKLLEIREIPFDAEDARISCFPHVVNLATQRILQSLTNPDLMGETDNFEDDDNEGQPEGARESNGEDSEDNTNDSDDNSDNSDNSDDNDDNDSDGDNIDEASDGHSNTPRKGATTYQDACNRDPITLCRKIARIVRSSGQRREEFDELIMKGNKRGWFKVDGETVQVPVLQLLLDVRTRWDSVFTMIKRFIELQPVRLIMVFEYFFNVGLRLSLDYCQKMLDFYISASLSMSGRCLVISLSYWV